MPHHNLLVRPRTQHQLSDQREDNAFKELLIIEDETVSKRLRMFISCVGEIDGRTKVEKNQGLWTSVNGRASSATDA